MEADYTREQKALSVTQITSLIKETLEGGFRGIDVEGEISNYRPASSGHVYFSLKDHTAMIDCVLFRSSAARLDFQPRDGQQVRVRGDLSVYARRGNYQIIVSRMSLAGEGDILILLEERKRRLAEEGLFAEEKKRALPLSPDRIGVVSSPTGAAVRDILQVLGRRRAGISVLVLPATVQGEGAAEQIARQIRTANIHKLADVLIVGRGGGSLEDLLPFSEEIVVRAIAESDIPVISAVGHEIDWALSDFAADLRAPTPSAAAELVAASGEELAKRLSGALRHLVSGMRNRTATARLLAERFSPHYMERTLRGKLQPLLLRLDDGKEELIAALHGRIEKSRHCIALTTERLRSGSPQLIMQKGYALILHKEQLLTDANQTTPGDPLDIRLARGSLSAAVTEVHPEKHKT